MKYVFVFSRLMTYQDQEITYFGTMTFEPIIELNLIQTNSTFAFRAISYPSCVSLHIRSIGKESWYSPRKTLGPQVSHKKEFPADILIACQKSTTSIPLRFAKNRNIQYQQSVHSISQTVGRLIKHHAPCMHYYLYGNTNDSFFVLLLCINFYSCEVKSTTII